MEFLRLRSEQNKESAMKKCVQIAMSSALAVLFAGGCCSERYCAVPLVDDVGGKVATKYRYNLSCIYFGETMDRGMIKHDCSFLPRCQPRVFSSSGIPFVLRMELGRLSMEGGWSILFPMLSLGILPEFSRETNTYKCLVELADGNEVNSPFEYMSVRDSARSLLPTAFLFYNDEAKVEGRRVFCDKTQHLSDRNEVGRDYPLSFEAALDSRSNWMGTLELRMNSIGRQAFAYAIAVKLKELEDSGRIDAILAKKSSAPAYDVVRRERDRNSDFAYSFEMKMEQAPSDVEAAKQAVLCEVAEMVKKDYLDTYPNADASSIVVSTSGVKVDGVRIECRVEVLTIKLIFFDYDSKARHGKLAVRFNVGQAESARKWIRKNIETLARDKNIALVTGEIPPAAKFYLAREELKDGNVLEIEFRTE